jgi:hypothetical protein
MRPALDPAGHRVPRTKPTCLLHTWRPHRQRPFALVLHLHQHKSSRNLHLQYLAKNQSTQCCQSLITPRRNHPPVLKPQMVLTTPSGSPGTSDQITQDNPKNCLRIHPKLSINGSPKPLGVLRRNFGAMMNTPRRGYSPKITASNFLQLPESQILGKNTMN